MKPPASDDEREVRDLLAAAERPVVVPPFGAIQRRDARTPLATVALVAVVVIVASAALGAALRDFREGVSAGVVPFASPMSTPTEPSPSPAATGSGRPTATSQLTPATPLSGRYGVIIDAGPPYLRSETDPQRIGQLSGELFGGAVSPDGRKIAYWQYSNGAPTVLAVLDSAAPAQPRALLRVSAGEVAGGVVWSSDGTGLLIAVNSRDFVQQPPDAPRLFATLRQVDVATGSVREVVRNEPGHPFFPIAWDRGRGVSVAVSGVGGFVSGYVMVRDDGSMQVADLPATTLPQFVRAAPDGSRVLMLHWQDSSAVSVWPLTEPAQRVTLRPDTGERVVAAMWRDAREIVASVARTADASEAERLEIWPLDGQRRVVLSAQHRLDAVRPDGTAAITSAGVVDLTTGALAKMPGDPGPVAASFLLPETRR